MKNLLLIDGNNVAIGCAFVHDLSVDLDNPAMVFDSEASLQMYQEMGVENDGNRFPTGVLHGFFTSIASIRKQFPDHYCAVVWDGGNTRRVTASMPAVHNKIIPERYKENRKKKDAPKEIQDFMRQKAELRNAISLTNIPQILVPNEEADDVIASYATQYAPDCDSVIIYSGDKDYYQLLDDKVRIWRNHNLIGVHWFRKEFGINPQQWVDVGALCGDAGDNIFGIPGWGDRTAIAAIAQHGSVEKAMAVFHEEMDGLRQTYPDLDEEGLARLQQIKLPSGKAKYPFINENTPFTGVAMAVEEKKVKKTKTTILALMFEERVKLAKQLKAMQLNLHVPILPGWQNTPPWRRAAPEKFQAFCNKYALEQVRKNTELLCDSQPD